MAVNGAVISRLKKEVTPSLSGIYAALLCSTRASFIVSSDVPRARTVINFLYNGGEGIFGEMNFSKGKDSGFYILLR